MVVSQCWVVSGVSVRYFMFSVFNVIISWSFSVLLLLPLGQLHFAWETVQRREECWIASDHVGSLSDSMMLSMRSTCSLTTCWWRLSDCWWPQGDHCFWFLWMRGGRALITSGREVEGGDQCLGRWWGMWTVDSSTDGSTLGGGPGRQQWSSASYPQYRCQ